MLFLSASKFEKKVYHKFIIPHEVIYVLFLKVNESFCEEIKVFYDVNNKKSFSMTILQNMKRHGFMTQEIE